MLKKDFLDSKENKRQTPCIFDDWQAMNRHNWRICNFRDDLTSLCDSLTLLETREYNKKTGVQKKKKEKNIPS